MRSRWWGLLAGTAVLALPTPAAAQAAPAWSRGLQQLAISLGECARRAEAAEHGEGYDITNRSSPGDDAFFLGGQKGLSSAIIMCDRGADGKTWVNIVVASTSGDSGVPGGERQRLQRRMDIPSSNAGGR